jgi:hypothetical protein
MNQRINMAGSNSVDDRDIVISTCLENGSARLSASPDSFAAHAAAIVDELCEETKKICQLQFADSLRSLVLTGSLARAEGTFSRENGDWQPLSDAEFIVSLTDSVKLPSTQEQRELGERITDALSARGLDCSLSLSVVHGGFYRKLRPSMYAYELRQCGRCVAGDPGILSLIPAFSAADIPLEDAWRTLCNRLLEQIESIAESEPGSWRVSNELLYRSVKLYLDMATSFLLFLGIYEPSYRARGERLSALNQNTLPGTLPFDITQFAATVAACTEWKLQHESKPDLGSPWELWLSSQRDATRLLQWELSRLTHRVAPQRDLNHQWMRSQQLAEKVRGWMYVLRATGWLRSWRLWPRWMRCAAQGSPRRLVYAAAGELYALLPGFLSGEVDDLRAAHSLKQIEDLLPVANVRSRSGGSNWRQVAEMCCWNYHQFLKNTRS